MTRNARRSGAWLLPALPGVLLYAATYVPALVALLALGFFTYRPGLPPEPTFTLDNFTRFLTDPYYLDLLADTLRISFIASLIAVLLAYPVAHALVNSPRLRRLLLPIVAVSFFVPALLRLYGWMSMLGSDGLVNGVLSLVGLPAASLLFSEPAVIIGLADYSIPFAVLTLAGAISYLDPDLPLAAKDLGATGFQTFMRVTLRMVLPGLTTAFVLSFVQSVSAVVTPLLLGGGRVPMLATQVYNSMIVSVNYPFASAIVLIIVLVVGALMSLVGRLGRSTRTEEGR